MDNNVKRYNRTLRVAKVNTGSLTRTKFKIPIKTEQKQSSIRQRLSEQVSQILFIFSSKSLNLMMAPSVKNQYHHFKDQHTSSSQRFLPQLYQKQQQTSLETELCTNDSQKSRRHLQSFLSEFLINSPINGSLKSCLVRQTNNTEKSCSIKVITTNERKSNLSRFHPLKQQSQRECSVNLNENENEDISFSSDEHNIWEGSDQEQDQREMLEVGRHPLELYNLFELLKYRYETCRYDSKPISCNQVVQQAKKLLRRNKKSYLKWFSKGQYDVKWLDFRDFTTK